MNSMLIKNADIITMNPARDVLRGDILVENGRIAGVWGMAHSGRGHLVHDEFAPSPHTLGAFAPDEVARSAVRVIDAAGQIVIPGLIQSHFHSTQVIFRGLADEMELLDWLRARIWPMEIAHSYETNALGAQLTAAELMMSGSTALIDMGSAYFEDAVFDVMSTAGMRGLFGKSMFDVPDKGARHIAVQDTEECLEDAERLMKKWHGACNGRIGYAYALRFAPTSTPELLNRSRETARANGIRLHTHCLENRSECDYVHGMFGKGYLRYLHDMGYTGEDVILAHCIWVDDDDVKCLADSGSHAVHCPSSNMKLASGIAKIPEMLAAGCNISMGLDGAHNHMDALLELRQAALMQKARLLSPVALPPMQVLEMATMGGARAMGQEKEIGSIETGKKADLALIDLRMLGGMPVTGRHPVNQVVYQATREHVRLTMVDGKILYEDGKFHTLDMPQIMRDAERIMDAFLRRPEIAALF